MDNLSLARIFGFSSIDGFARSLCQPQRFTMKTKLILSILASIASLLEAFVGVPIAVIMAFVLLNIFEWVTGMMAAKFKGLAIESRKMGRALLKTFVYVSLLGILNQFKRYEGGDGFWYMFAWVYWFLFSGISLILVRSIFENLHIMGVKEAMIIYEILDNKYTKFFKEIAAPPSDEKLNRK